MNPTVDEVMALARATAAEYREFGKDDSVPAYYDGRKVEQTESYVALKAAVERLVSP